MSELHYDQKRIERSLAGLTPKARLAFAISCVERLLPNYLKFSKLTGFGSSEPLRRALELAWRSLSLEPVSIPREIRDACAEAAPYPEDFDTILASSALDAANAAVAMLNELESNDAKGALEASGYCRDTVDMYVQFTPGFETGPGGIEERIRLHPLMQRELSRQYYDLKLLHGQWNWNRLKDIWSKRSGSLEEGLEGPNRGTDLL